MVSQTAVPDKNNGLTAIPRLLDRMVLERAVVTIDAVGCQQTIVLALKHTLHRNMIAAFANTKRDIFTPTVQDQ